MFRLIFLYERGAKPLGARSGRRQMQGGARNPPGAYWVVREEGFRSDNVADDPSWTGSYGQVTMGGMDIRIASTDRKSVV